MSFKHGTALIILLITANAAAQESSARMSPSSYTSLNVVTTSTESVMGDAVARYFSQFLYLQKISIRSGLTIREKKLSGSTSEITLETPLRVVSTHQFLTTQSRRWSEPQSVAQGFITDAQKDGLLTSIAHITN